MKTLLTAALVLAASPILVQAQETGVSHPDPTPITVQAPDEQSAQPAKPSAAKPVDPDADIVTLPPAAEVNAMQQNGDSSYHPYHSGTAPTPTLTQRTAMMDQDRPLDIDADVVTSVPSIPGEIPEGTLLKVRMNDSVSTRSTLQGTAFTATVVEDIRNDGRVVIPAGSILDGMVTEVHGGHRISGRAAIHLEPRRVTLPDGTYYPLHAQIIDTTEESSVRVNNEGTLVGRDHAKETIAVMSATTGSAAVAGAMLAGGVGAAVGAGIGVGAGTVLWLRQNREAALPRDTGLTFSLTTPLVLHPVQNGAQLR